MKGLDGGAVRRGAALALVGLVVLPLPALLDPEVAGPAASATRQVAMGLLATTLAGTAAVVAAATLLSLAGPKGALPLAGLVDDVARWIRATPPRRWALLCAGVGLAGSGAVAHLVLAHEPLLLDEMVQLRHARLLADGMPAEAWPFDPAFRDTQNGVWSGEGWSSIYPPGHTVLLALAVRLGIVAWTGPLLAGIALFFWSASLLLLLGSRPLTARVAGLAAALSPFLWGTSAGYLSHPTALAAAAVALWAALRARDGAATWALLAGAAAGVGVVARPLTGICLGLAISGGLLTLGRGDPPAGDRAKGVRLLFWAAGGLPFALALAWWNRHLYGAPTLLGYEAAFGPAHGLGWHTDPWGNRYGVVEALGYTGADLIQLGRALLETPVSPLIVVGAWLVAARRLAPGTGTLLAWALLPVAAHLSYWHHGIHLGPRMLSESAPAWLALGVVALAWWTDEARPPALRRGAIWATVVALGWAAAIGIPGRVGSWSALTLEVQAPPDPTPALVFVHGSWSSRIAARLAATGMRRDSIETAMRRNDLCRVHHYAEARTEGRTPLPTLDLAPHPGPGPDLEPVTLSQGNRAWIDPDRPPSPECVRAARSDARGVTPLARVLAEAEPPTPEAAVVWVRDMGPEANRALVDAYPDRRAWSWGTNDGWLTFDEAMRLLWGG